MITMKPGSSQVAVIGDIVASREAVDRAAVHDSVVAALRVVDRVVPSVRGLAVTFGDEFQGLYPTLGAALDVALRVRLLLLPEVDVRLGVGRGDAVVLDATRGIEDGSAWWRARDAIDAVEAGAERAPTRRARTGFRDTDGATAEVAAVGAALLCQDHLVGSLSNRSLRLLKGLMDNTTQAELAEREGISPSAVSQRVRTDGIGVILAAHEQLRSLP